MFKLTKKAASRGSFRFAIAAILGLQLLTSCATQPNNVNLSSSTSQVPPGKGIVVIGIAGNATASFRSGKLFGDGSFEHDNSRATEFSSALGQSYIVRALDATSGDDRYAMFRASAGGRSYDFECGQILPVLTVNDGEVQYYGDFRVVVSGGKLKVQQTFDIEKASQFLSSRFPNGNWDLQPGTLDRARSTQCLQVPPAAIVG